MRRIALIDYGSGNLPSASKALRRAAQAVGAAEIIETDDPETIRRADAVVLPGVGAFAACMSALRARTGVLEALEHAVRRRGAPFLGICVGLQLMAEEGLEFGRTPGLGWMGGCTRRLEPHGPQFKLPHMGWNGLEGPMPAPLFDGLKPGDHMYFTHAFAFQPSDPAVTAAWTDHGGPFVSAVLSGNLAGVQFHPEKSQGAGARLLRNFLEWRP